MPRIVVTITFELDGTDQLAVWEYLDATALRQYPNITGIEIKQEDD